MKNSTIIIEKGMKNKKVKANLNAGLGMVLNALMCAGVFVSFNAPELFILVAFAFLALLITSFLTMKKLYKIKEKGKREFENVRFAFGFNLFNLILMSVGLTNVSLIGLAMLG